MTPDARSAKGPLTLSPELREAMRRIAQTEHLLVALDFDGTISPIVDRADDARPLPRSAAAFAGLAALPRTTTALPTRVAATWSGWRSAVPARWLPLPRRR